MHIPVYISAKYQSKIHEHNFFKKAIVIPVQSLEIQHPTAMRMRQTNATLGLSPL